MRGGIPFVVAAPSGTGKTTVCRAVVERDSGIVFSVSHTTRAPRAGERHGADYHFVSEPDFRKMVDEGAFLEWARYNDHLYGTSFAAIESALAEGRDVLLEIEVQGARQVRERRPDARLIFLLPPSVGELERRLVERGTDPPEAVRRRLETARREFEAMPLFDYLVPNDVLEDAVRRVLEIVVGERAGERDALLLAFGRDAQLPRFRRALGLC